MNPSSDLIGTVSRPCNLKAVIRTPSGAESVVGNFQGMTPERLTFHLDNTLKELGYKGKGLFTIQSYIIQSYHHMPEEVESFTFKMKVSKGGKP